MRARLLTTVGALLVTSIGRAGPSSIEPLVGVATEYASNPYLLSTDAHSFTDVVFLLDAPARYDLDAAHFSLTPSIRYSSGGTYASLASNYFHLNASAAFSSELNSLVIEANFSRDSSLYHNGLSSNGVGVRVDGSTVQAEWQHAFTERAQLTVDAAWNRGLYDQAGNEQGLLDYRYVSVGPAASYQVDERDKLQILTSFGRYVSLDGFTESKNYSVQLGFTRQVTPLWTASGSAGYAQSNNSEDVYFGPFFLGTAKSEQKGPVFSASLVRQSEVLGVTASASRAFRPSGFNYLSRQDVGELDLNYTYSERWSYAAKGIYQITATPIGNGESSVQHFFSAALSAGWHWTPEWTISLAATWVKVQYDAPPSDTQSSGVSLKISRQFLRIDL